MIPWEVLVEGSLCIAVGSAVLLLAVNWTRRWLALPLAFLLGVSWVPYYALLYMTSISLPAAIWAIDAILAAAVVVFFGTMAYGFYGTMAYGRASRSYCLIGAVGVAGLVIQSVLFRAIP